jgi:hypothetical protein
MPRPGEPDRLAGGGEPVCPGQPAGHRQRGERPDPVQPRGQHLGAGQVPGGIQQLMPDHVQPGLQRLGHLQRGGHLQLPGRGQMGHGSPQRGYPRPGAQHARAQGRGALVEQHRAAAPGRCARGADHGRSPAAPGIPGRATAGSSTPAAGPRPAASSDAASRSCRSWRAACGRARPRCRPARPAPLPNTATRRTPRPRTRRPPGRRTGPARPAGAPGQPGRSGRAAPARSRCRGSQR